MGFVQQEKSECRGVSCPTLDLLDGHPHWNGRIWHLFLALNFTPPQVKVVSLIVKNAFYICSVPMRKLLLMRENRYFFIFIWNISGQQMGDPIIHGIPSDFAPSSCFGEAQTFMLSKPQAPRVRLEGYWNFKTRVFEQQRCKSHSNGSSGWGYTHYLFPQMNISTPWNSEMSENFCPSALAWRQ